MRTRQEASKTFAGLFETVCGAMSDVASGGGAAAPRCLGLRGSPDRCARGIFA
jgi:hypothetical protein